MSSDESQLCKALPTKARNKITLTHLSSLNILMFTSKLSYEKQPKCPQDSPCNTNDSRVPCKSCTGLYKVTVCPLCQKCPLPVTAQTQLEVGGDGSSLQGILKHQPIDNHQGSHSISWLAQQWSFCISVIYGGIQGKTLWTALQLLLLYKKLDKYQVALDLQKESRLW